MISIITTLGGGQNNVCLFCLRRSRQRAAFQRLRQLVKAELPVTKRKRSVASGEESDKKRPNISFTSAFSRPELPVGHTTSHLQSVLFHRQFFFSFFSFLKLHSPPSFFFFFFAQKYDSQKWSYFVESSWPIKPTARLIQASSFFATFRRIPLRDKQKTKNKIADCRVCLKLNAKKKTTTQTN